MGKGYGELRTSYNWVSDSPIFWGSDEEFSNYEIRDYKTWDIRLKYGVHEKIDVGMKAGLLSGITVDTKVQLLGDFESPFAIAAGFGAGLRENGVLEFPLYFSAHPSEYLSFYVTPRYIRQKRDLYKRAYGTDLFHFKGYNMGAFYGWEDIQIGIDYGRYWVSGGKRKVNTSTIGISVKYLFSGD